MAANPWEEGQFEALNDLESARLALRGALATIRDLQDANLRLKGNLQEFANREKLAQQEISQIQAHLRELEERERKCQEEHQSAQGSAALREQVRQHLLEEEKTRIEQDRKETEAELARLHSAVEGLRMLNEQKEREWQDLKRLLEFREAELLAVQRDKTNLINRYREESVLFEELRLKRETEARSALRIHDEEAERKNAQLRELQKKNRELAEALASATDDADRRLREREQNLLQEYRVRQQSLQELYAKRQAEIEAAWNQMEQTLWQNTKEAQKKLDLAAQEQFYEQSRQLAERRHEVESTLEIRRKELEEEFQKRLGRLDTQAEEREKLAAERERQRLESEFNQKEHQAQMQRADKEQALEAERRKRELELHESILKKEEELQTRVAAKEQELEESYHRRQSELQDLWLNKEKELQEEWNRRKMSLLENQEKEAAAEKAVLRAQAEQESRRVDGSYRARVAELERMQQTVEEQFRTWKATAIEEFLQKEKDLDKRWLIREQELVRKYEDALEQERRTVHFEVVRTRDQYEQIRKRGADEFLQRAEALKEKYEATLQDREAGRTRQEAEIQAMHQAEIGKLRDDHRRFIAQQAKHYEDEMARAEEGWKVSITGLREKHQSEILEAERQLLETQLSVKNLKERISKVEAEEVAHRSAFEADQARMETEFFEKEKDLESRLRHREDILKREREKLYAELKHKEEVLRQAIYRESSETLEAELRAKEAEWLAREQATAQSASMKEERLKAQYDKREELLKSEWAHREADLVTDYELRLEKEKRRLSEIELAMTNRLKQRTQELERETKATLAQKEAMLMHRHQEALARERAKLEHEFAERQRALERKKPE